MQKDVKSAIGVEKKKKGKRKFKDISGGKESIDFKKGAVEESKK